ncbi:hypothetical protein [Paenibacillus eucommiae]|uniref:Secreted protein n=1 Tax=Paenibacillus eucommiae TaxID=1355755 RepID=A0ABS4IX30_9BACL|nr:hypothetical protein [Paenibacillus eucommiae]MBP1992068.1 hypothetical protein [Paenibacillus eucommiae]
MLLHLTMFFIVKVRMWRGPATLTMKIIVKVQVLSVVHAGVAVLQPQRLGLPGNLLQPREKHLAGSPFELGVRAIRTIVAEKREGVWEEAR